MAGTRGVAGCTVRLERAAWQAAQRGWNARRGRLHSAAGTHGVAGCTVWLDRAAWQTAQLS
ncbi:MAG: hypothetical protein ACOYIH_03585 [Candidatus Fimadaptatus sp.]